jgi:hypothetical protein
MKKLILLTIASAFSISLMAQDDDMYFVPTKENLAKEAKMYGMPQNVYYSGSNRSVDDYNRRTMFSYPADSTSNDIIDFSAVRGVYPDSITASVAENDDYKLTRRMSRFDDYTPSEAYWDGYRAGRWSSPWYNTWYSWYDPWYYDSWWYWNDPFYYSSWYYGWRYPYYYSTWYSPRYYGGYISYRPTTTSGRRIVYDSGRIFGRSSNDNRTTTVNNNRSFGQPSRNTNTSPTFSSGSSGRSSGGSFSGGGGGGGRSTSGGRSFGGRR